MRNVQAKPSLVRQHFNFLRNNSSRTVDCLTWGHLCEDSLNDGNDSNDFHNHNDTTQSRKNVSFAQGIAQPIQTRSPLSHSEQKNVKGGNVKPTPNQEAKSKTAAGVSKMPKRSNKRPQSVPKSQMLEKILQKEKSEAQTARLERREKVKTYVQDQRPFTRSMTNTRYQEYYDRAALESYGRANTKQTVGGIIYGTHLKTFNVNPHVYTNQPSTYQTHRTALNYARRTIRCQQEKAILLQKQLSKKLGLDIHNETLQKGKEVVFVDVDSTNLEAVLKETLQYKKKNRDAIAKAQKQYASAKKEEAAKAVQQFYERKEAKIEQALSTKEGSFEEEGDATGERAYQQRVYRQEDEHGHVRLGADRHALKCFVDMNFSQNSDAYTCQLNKRLPIYPQLVIAPDNTLDLCRKQNCKQSKNDPLPSHYLRRNVNEPEVIKILNERIKNSKKFSKTADTRA